MDFGSIYIFRCVVRRGRTLGAVGRSAVRVGKRETAPFLGRLWRSWRLIGDGIGNRLR